MSTLKVDTLNTRTGSGNITFSRPIVADISNVTGTLPMARLTGTLPALNGSALTALNATQLTSGTIPIARIADDAVTNAKMADDAIGVAQLSATGTASNTTFLRGDNSWQTAGSTSASDLTSGTLPMARLSGTLPALNGSALTGLPASGDKRNYIIDGDFTQWPEGTSQTSLASGHYGPAMWRWWGANAQSRSDVQRSTDVPTVAQSGHQSAYSLQIDCTTAEDAVAAGEWAHIDYHVTGSDFAHLHKQEVTLNFWHKHTKTGTFCVAFRNSAQNRSYIAEYTQTTTNTWEEATITLTLDTGGTWLFTEYDIGLTIFFTLYTGSTYQAAANTWHAGDYAGTSNQVNGLDSTSNECLFSQVSLTVGSTAPDFTSPSISTVKNQVDYYVQRYNLNSSAYETLCGLNCRSGTHAKATMNLRNELRTSPTVTSSAASTWSVNSGSNDAAPTTIAFSAGGRTGWNIDMTVSSRTTGHSGYLYRTGTNTTFIMFDARH